MSLRPIVVCIAAVLVTTPLLAAKQMTDREMLKAEAQHVCYDDAQKLCPDAIPDESKVETCMRSKRTQLSPECSKVFEKGDKQQ